MTVISPGGDFLNQYKTVMQNNSLDGNIPVIKSLLFCGGGREGRREGRGGGREPTVHSNASKLAAVLVDSFFPHCLVVRREERREKREEEEEEKTEERREEGKKRERKKERRRKNRARKRTKRIERKKKNNTTLTTHTTHHTTPHHHQHNTPHNTTPQHNTTQHLVHTQRTTAPRTTVRDLEAKKRMLGYVHFLQPTMILLMPFLIHNCNNCNVCNVCNFDADLRFSIFLNL